MARKPSESANRGSGTRASKVLGRSAVTEGLILKPASKPGKLSIQSAKAAVQRVLAERSRDLPGAEPECDDPPRFTREMAARGRHMVGDRMISKTQAE